MDRMEKIGDRTYLVYTDMNWGAYVPVAGDSIALNNSGSEPAQDPAGNRPAVRVFLRMDGEVGTRVAPRRAQARTAGFTRRGFRDGRWRVYAAGAVVETDATGARRQGAAD